MKILCSGVGTVAAWLAGTMSPWCVYYICWICSIIIL